MFKIERATESERKALALVRAIEWGDGLSPTEFQERNDRLYSHPFGIKHTETFVLKSPNGEIVTSMDSVSVPVLKWLDGKLEGSRTFLVASLVTPKAHRGKGYAGRLLDDYFSKVKGQNGILYSDIGLGFYEKWDFEPSPCWSFTLPASSRVKAELKSIGIGSVLSLMGDVRKKKLLGLSENAFAFDPEGEWMDWHLTRFRYIASLENQVLPRELGWLCPAGSFLVTPVFQKKTLYALWMESSACVPYLQRLAFDLGFSKIYYWDEKPGGTGEIKYPMAQGAKVIDCQYVDWW